MFRVENSRWHGRHASGTIYGKVRNQSVLAFGIINIQLGRLVSQKGETNTIDPSE